MPANTNSELPNYHSQETAEMSNMDRGSCFSPFPPFYYLLSTCQPPNCNIFLVFSLTTAKPAKSEGLRGTVNNPLYPEIRSKLFFGLTQSIQFAHSHHITHKSVMLKNTPRISSIAVVSIHTLILQYYRV
jgi:hypothetical protein